MNRVTKPGDVVENILGKHEFHIDNVDLEIILRDLPKYLLKLSMKEVMSVKMNMISMFGIY